MTCTKQHSQCREAMLELKAAIRLQRDISQVASTPDKTLTHLEMLKYLDAVRQQQKAEAKIYELFPG